MPEKQKILLDTNFLMLPVQNKVDIFSEIARICDSDYSLYVFDKSIDELDKIISTGKLKDRQAAKIAKALIKSKNIDIINSAHGDVDELILESAKTEGMGGLTQAQYLTQIGRMTDDVRSDPDVKDFVSIRDGYQRVQTGANLNNAQGDLALLFGYMKILDPNSVVRETEFANAEAAMGYAQRVINFPAKFLKGNRLTPEARKQFTEAADALYKAKEGNYTNAANFYKNQAETIGIDPNLVLRNFQVPTQQTGNIEEQIKTEINQFKGQYPNREAMLFDLYQGYPDVSQETINKILYTTWTDKK